MRRILVAPQELKGTLTAVEAADAIADGVRRARPDLELDLCPIADGGPGTVDAIVRAWKGAAVQRRVSRVHDPQGRPIDAAWAVIDHGDSSSAVIEMAAASGLTLLSPSERDPRITSTYGTGELIRAALDAGCSRVTVGAGGSATNDGGAGAASALGIRFLDAYGRPLPPGGAALRSLARIEFPDGILPTYRSLLVAVDVDAPLLGPRGASLVFAPQKGASPEVAAELDAALAHFAAVLIREVDGASLRAAYIRPLPDESLATRPGTGAAGGLAYGLAAIFGATITSGFEFVARAVDLDKRIAAADSVVTAEGRVDAQTAMGKGPGALLERARAAGKKTVLFAGAEQGAPAALNPIVLLGTAHDAGSSATRSALFRAAEEWARSI